MSQSNPNKATQLILAALHHREFLNDLPFVTFNHDALAGVIVTDPLQRNDILDLMGKSKFSPMNQQDSRPLFIPGHEFNEVIDNSHFDFKLGYHSNMLEINDDGEEELSLILVLNTEHKPIGFFKITLTHSQHTEHDHIIQITLDQILIDHQHRNRCNWMDLTNGTLTFLIVMLECLVASASVEDRLSIYLIADFVSRGGEKIGSIIFDELSCALDDLKMNYPEKAECIDDIIPQMD